MFFAYRFVVVLPVHLAQWAAKFADRAAREKFLRCYACLLMSGQQIRSFIHVADVSFVPKLRHVHLLGRPFAFGRRILHLPRQFSKFSNLQFVYPQLFFLLAQHEQLFLLFVTFVHQFQVYHSDFLLPSFLAFLARCLQILDFCLQALNHVLGNHLLTGFFVSALLFVQGKFLLKLLYLLVFAHIRIMSLHKSAFCNSYFLKENLGFFAQMVAFCHDILHLFSIFLFVSHHFQGFRLDLLDVEMALFFFFKCFKFSSQRFKFILLRLDYLIIVNTLQLPFSDEYAPFHFLDSYLLLLQLQSPHTNRLLFLVKTRESSSIILLFGFIFGQYLVQLLGKFIDLRFKFDILFYQPLLLVLLRQQLRQMIFRLFISLLFFLLGLEALFQELIPFLIAFLFVHVDLQSSVNHFDRQLLSAHLLYSCECNHTLCYMAEHRHSERSRSRSPRHHDNDRRDERREEVVPRFKLEETRTLLIEGGGTDLSEAENVFRELSINIGTSLPDEVTADGNNLFVKYPSVQAATAVVEHQSGAISLARKNLKLQYYPIRRVDLSLSYDWYCDKCDYKNFARRNRCYRCESEKTPTCRLSYSTQPAVKQVREESAMNCSLMVRGPAVAEIEEADLLASFQALAPVRDIRQIKNKLTGKFKDFAFIQFYTPEQTAQAYREGNDPEFRLAGQKVTVMYSRNKSEDDYFKPLPYETGRRQKRVRERPPQEDNYYHRQRQREIEIQKARPAITMEQLKQKREQEMKKNQPAAKELSEEQSKRRQAELLAKQWEREMKTQTVMYICPACSRKFNSAEQMRLHETSSDMHKFHMLKLNNMALAL